MITFDTARWEAEYHRRPSGFGHWVFKMAICRGYSWLNEERTFEGKYSECKAQAKAYIRSMYGKVSCAQIEVAL